MAQFKGSARARGMSPIRVSDANIAKMQQETRRIVEGMEKRQESIRRNDERILQAMQDDAAYSQRTRDRDYQIESQNLRTEQQQAEYNFRAQIANEQAAQKGLETIINSISQFSETASKVQGAFKEKQRIEDIQEGIRLRKLGGPTQLDLKFQQGIGYESVAQEIAEGNFKIADAAGAPASETAKARVLTYNESVGYFQEDLRQKAITQYKAFVSEQVAANPGVMDTAEGYNQFLDGLTIPFFQSVGVDPTQVTPELLGKALDEMQKIDTTLLSGVVAQETARNNALIEEQSTNLAYSNPEQYLAQGFRRVAGIKGYDEAHAWYKKLATAQDENGEFILTDDQWKNAVLRGDGLPYYSGKKEGFYTRGLEILNARAEARRTWDRNQNTTDRNNYTQESKQWHRHIIVEGNNSPEDIAAAEESFKDNVQGLPQWLKDYKKAGDPANAESNANLIAAAKDAEQRGILSQNLVDEVFKVDAKLGNELQDAYNKQNPFEKSEVYVQQKKIVGNLTKKKDQFGQMSQDTPESYRVSRRLESLYNSFVQERVANGESIADASDAAAIDISQRITQDVSNPQGTFYRKYNSALGVYEYPNLFTTPAENIVQQANTTKSAFASKLAAGEIKSLLDDPEGVLTQTELAQQIENLEKPGFTYNPKVFMVGERVKGSPYEVLAKIADVNGVELPPPPVSMQQLGAYSFKAKQLLMRFGSANRNIRGNGMGTYRLGNDYNEGLVPTQYRQPIIDSATAHGVSPAETAAMIEIESNWQPEVPSYNNSSFGLMQINRRAHPAFFANNDWKDPAANIEYGTQYYAGLKQRYGGDVIAAAMAYNGGPGNYDIWSAGQTPDWVKTEADAAEWRRVVTEMENHGKKFAKALYKYSGDPSVLNNPILQRR